MKGESFDGINGDKVEIDANGDAQSEISLFAMNPKTVSFETVANFKNGLEFVRGKKVHWVSGRDENPEDEPHCRFDNTRCPKLDSPNKLLILSLILGAFVVALSIALFVMCRKNRAYKVIPVAVES